MKKLRRKSVGFCILPQLMKSRKDARKYKRLYTDAEINVQIEKRRVKLESFDSYFYSTLLEWISDDIFLHNWKDENLMAKIEEYQAFRQRKYKEFLKEREELKTLELSVNGHYRKFVVD